jgi:hypothetical protein
VTAVEHTPDYYAVLGVTPTATPEQIKAAYRAAAKHAHPDAGGSLAAMQRLNQAHQVLSDPASRAEYNRLRTIETAAPQAHKHPHAGPAAHPQADARAAHEAREASAVRHRARLHHLQRLAQARANAWYILRRSTLAALLLGLVTRFFAAQTTDRSFKLLLAIIGFVPVYGVVLGLIFLVQPQIRLDLFDFVHHTLHPRSPDPHLTSSEKITLLGLALSFIPLALLWALVFAL